MSALDELMGIILERDDVRSLIQEMRPNTLSNDIHAFGPTEMLRHVAKMRTLTAPQQVIADGMNLSDAECRDVIATMNKLDGLG